MLRSSRLVITIWPQTPSNPSPASNINFEDNICFSWEQKAQIALIFTQLYPLMDTSVGRLLQTKAFSIEMEQSWKIPDVFEGAGAKAKASLPTVFMGNINSLPNQSKELEMLVKTVNCC